MGGEKMKKKILSVITALLTLIMILISVTAIVSAGLGNNKLSFMLYLNGGTVGMEEPPRVTDGITHINGLLWDTLDNTVANLYLEIGGAPVDIVDYTFSADLAVIKTGRSAIHAIDTVFFDDSSTIVLKVQDHAPAPYEGTFSGYGTGNLEGVLVHGTTYGDGTGVFIRSGTIMGWP
jgi:hypothetical protein